MISCWSLGEISRLCQPQEVAPAGAALPAWAFWGFSTSSLRFFSAEYHSSPRVPRCLVVTGRMGCSAASQHPRGLVVCEPLWGGMRGFETAPWC